MEEYLVTMVNLTAASDNGESNRFPALFLLLYNIFRLTYTCIQTITASTGDSSWKREWRGPLQLRLHWTWHQINLKDCYPEHDRCQRTHSLKIKEGSCNTLYRFYHHMYSVSRKIQLTSFENDAGRYQSL